MLDAADMHGRSAPVLEDVQRKPLSYGLAGACLAAQVRTIVTARAFVGLAKLGPVVEPIGELVPAVIAAFLNSERSFQRARGEQP